MIAIDQTLIFQIIGFFILLIILNRFLYNPVLRILKEREEKISGAIKKAAELEKEVVEGVAAYEKRLKEAAVRGNEERSKIRQEGIDREKALLEAARTEAAAEIASMRKELEASKASALSSLKVESKSLSQNIAEKILDRKVIVMLFAFILPLLPAIAGAAPEGGEHGGSGTTWKIINFVILAVGVYLVWTKAIKGLLDKRSADIKQAIDQAKEAKDIADRKASEYNAKLNVLESRIAEIQNELRLEGEAEKQRIMQEAQASSLKIKEQAKLAAEQEIKKARLEIRREVAEIAVGMAEEILRKELKPEDQEKLVKGYLNNLRLN
ncbi:MAG: hypothetical protein HYS21_11010 [Deltaproteobacteria bacterium]|nr:hypothetical protein [Deltaproteobacteria bacterium]